MLKHLFLRAEILSRLIFSQSDEQVCYVQATHQQKARRAFPEEIIRQLFVLSLLHDYKYPEDLISLELPIQMGREKKRADIAVLDALGNVRIIIEVKVIHDEDSMPQLMSYMAITGASYGAIVSGSEIECIKRLSSQDVMPINDLPIFLGNDTFSEPKIQSESDPQPTKSSTSGISIEIEGFERSTPAHAKITIKGHTLELSNVELESYKKLRKRFLSVGVALSPDVKQTEWFDKFSRLLEATPISDSPISLENDASSVTEMESEHNPQPDVTTTPYVPIEIEGFERSTPARAKITIKGHTLQLSNVEIESYKKLRQKFLVAGVALNPNVKQAEWFEIFSQLLENTPITYSTALNNGATADGIVLKSINEALQKGQQGFAGGWISSFAIDQLFDAHRYNIPRRRRRSILQALGYDWHPRLHDGRTTVLINDMGIMGRPVLFVKSGHSSLNLTNAGDVTQAYIKAQESAEKIDQGVSSGSNSAD